MGCTFLGLQDAVNDGDDICESVELQGPPSSPNPERERERDTETERSHKKEKGKKKAVALAPIAKPLAGKKLCKKTLKLVRKAAEHKCLKRGVKEVVKSIRRGNKGLCVIAGNIWPMDVITHVLILSEHEDIPYIYVPTKEDLASAEATKRPTCCVLAQEEQEKLKTDFDQVVSEVTEVTKALF